MNWRRWDPRRKRGEIRWLWRQTHGFRTAIVALMAGNAGLSLFGVAFAAVSKQLIDRASGAAAGGMAGPLVAMAGLVLILIVGQAALGLLAPRLTVRMEHRLRADLYSGLQAASWNELRRHHSGDLLTRLTSDIASVVQGVTAVMPEVLSMLVRLAGALAYLAFMDATLAVAALAAGPLFLIPGRFFASRLRDLEKQNRENEGRLRGFVQESLRKNETVKAFNLEPVFDERLAGHQSEAMRLQMRRAWLSLAPGVGLTSGYWAGHLVALAWGASRMAAGQATFGTLTAFLQLVGHVQGPFHILARSVPRLASILASVERLQAIESLPPDPDDAPIGLHESTTPTPGAVDLEFDKVTFTYDKEPVLRDVSFRIRAGERVAVAGPSGVGKTTILRLLLGLVHPDSGSVRVREAGAGDAGRRASRATRRYFAHVSQGNTLFSGTLIENVLLGRPGGGPESAHAACRNASADGYIRQLPDAYHTRIGENGDGLSEGQAQRIALARALLRDAPVLLLDEATSALDRATECAVLDHLRTRDGRRTLIVVSHRPEVLAVCDRVLTVSEGRVDEHVSTEAKST